MQKIRIELEWQFRAIGPVSMGEFTFAFKMTITFLLMHLAILVLFSVWKRKPGKTRKMNLKRITKVDRMDGTKQEK